MDPQTTLNQAEQCIRDGHFEGAFYYLNEYAGWRGRGGFEPTNGDNRHLLMLGHPGMVQRYGVPTVGI